MLAATTPFTSAPCWISRKWTEYLQIFIRSRPALQQATGTNISGVSTLPSRIFSLITSLTNSRFANTLSNSMSNIRAHYDLSNNMFSSFLSKDMTYSCAIFPELDADFKHERQGGLGDLNGGIGLKRITGERPFTPESQGHRDKEETDELYEAQIAKLRLVEVVASVWRS